MATLTSPSPVIIENGGVLVTSTFTLNFVGGTVTQNPDGSVDVDISGAGGGANTSLTNLVAPVQPNQDIDLQDSIIIEGVPYPLFPDQVASMQYVLDAVAAAPGTGANVFLSNLSATSINADLIPSVTGTRALGTNALVWNYLYVYNIMGAADGNPLRFDTPVRSGAGESTGNLDFNTGAAASNTSGNLNFHSGSSGTNTGSISFSTGTAISGGSGVFDFVSGTIPSSASGTITGGVTLRSGNVTGVGSGTARSGGIELKSGDNSSTNVSATSGDILLKTGTTAGGAGTRGKIRCVNKTAFVLPIDGADPVAGDSEHGQMYFNSITNKFRGYDGSAWVDLN